MREHIDRALKQAGRNVQDYKSAHLHAGWGVALTNFPLLSRHGFADYLVYIDGKATGVIEVKQEGVTLAGIEVAGAIKEQCQIVVEVERRFSVIEELEATVEANLTRADRLRQSILTKAFSGCLANLQ